MPDSASVVTGPKLGQVVYADIGANFPNSLRALLRALDALVQASVKDITLATPPGSPADGDAYIVATGGTGAWAGKDGQIAVWSAEIAATDTNTKVPAWEFHAPKAGWLAYNTADAQLHLYNGSAWSAFSGGAGSSTFTALTDAPASYSGSGGYAVQVNAGATALVFAAKPFDVSCFAAGVGTASQKLIRVALARAVTFPAGAALSQAKASAAATASTTFTLSQNGTAFATVNFAASASSATWTQASDANFAAGDVLEIDGPATADATLADVGITLAGVRA